MQLEVYRVRNLKTGQYEFLMPTACLRIALNTIGL